LEQLLFRRDHLNSCRAVFGYSTPEVMEMGPNGDHMGWWGTGWSWVFLVLLVVGIVILIVVLVRAFAARGPRQTPHRIGTNGARELLDERYARGEIDTSEYDERRQRLDGAPDA